MHPETPDRARPGALDRAVHQPAARTGTDEGGRKPEEAQFAFIAVAKVELEQPGLAAAGLKHANLDARIMDDRGKLGVIHHQPREPDPILADEPKQIAKPGKVRLRNVLQREI